MDAYTTIALAPAVPEEGTPVDFEGGGGPPTNPGGSCVIA